MCNFCAATLTVELHHSATAKNPKRLAEKKKERKRLVPVMHNHTYVQCGTKPREPDMDSDAERPTQPHQTYQSHVECVEIVLRGQFLRPSRRLQSPTSSKHARSFPPPTVVILKQAPAPAWDSTTYIKQKGQLQSPLRTHIRTSHSRTHPPAASTNPRTRTRLRTTSKWLTQPSTSPRPRSSRPSSRQPPTSWLTSSPTGARPAEPSPPSSNPWPPSTASRATWRLPRSTSTTFRPWPRSTASRRCPRFCSSRRASRLPSMASP